MASQARLPSSPRLDAERCDERSHAPRHPEESVLYEVLWTELDATFTNTGTVTALDSRLVAVHARVLQGVGTAVLDPTLGLPLPISLGALDPGASTTVRLNLRVDPGVVRFALTEEGAVTADFGTFGFALTQASYR